MSIKKKDKAIVLITNDASCFAAANVIMNIEKNDPKLIDEYVVITSNISQCNKEALSKIVANICFIDFSADDFFKKAPCVPRNSPFLTHWGHLSMAHFEIFDLLKRYRNILCLDTDMYVNQSIAKIFLSNSLAWRASSADFHDFIKDYIVIPKDMTMPNCGVLFINDKLPHYETLTRECYKLLNDSYGKIRSDKGHDGIILGILNYKLKLNAELLPMIYNCPLGGKQTNKAIILQFMGPIKIWKNPVLWNMFPDFKNNYKLFIAHGGQPYKGSLLLGDGIFDKNFGLLQSYQIVVNTLHWDELLGDMYLNLPDGVIQSMILTKSYVRYYLTELNNTSIYYEISSITGKNVKNITFNIIDKNYLQNTDIKQKIRRLSNLLSFEYIEDNDLISCKITVKNSEVSNSFLLFIESTKDSFIKFLTV